MRILSSLGRLGAVLTLLGVGLGSGSAAGERSSERSSPRAGKKDEFQLHYQAALQQYKKENFEQALAEFQKAYELDPQPGLLFNIGQLHKKLGHGRAAIDAYELFLQTDTDLAAKQREEVQRVINDLRGADPTLEPTPAPLRQLSPLELAQSAKAGRFMANLSGGLAVGLNYSELQVAIQLEAGYSIFSNRNGYIVLPLQFQLSQSLKLIMIPVGFHYDFMLPVRGLYVGARGSIGYAVGFADTLLSPFATSGVLVQHFGLFLPEASLKYVLKGRINLGITPVSLPILFNGNGAVAFYRLLLFGGANF